MVADVLGIEIIEKGVGTVIEGDAEDRHVVGVHHPVTETVGLPVGDHRGVAFDDFAEHCHIRLFLLQTVGVVAVQHMFGQLFELLMLLGVIEVLEVTEADMAGRQAQYHRCAFLFLPPHRRAGAGHAQCPRARDAEGVQVFTGEKLADR